MLNYYIEIVKPGIIFGNIVLMTGSFLFASRTHFNFFLFLYTLLGLSFVIASACVFNNIIDSDIDARMQRTKNRVLVKKKLKFRQVLTFGFFMGLLGCLILGYYVNILSMFLAVFAFIVYVFLYTYLTKRISVHSTLVGSFSGSIPSVIGYTAVVNTVNFFSILLFINFIFWQMSHFYSISIFRISDYKNANIPIFPIVKNVLLAKKHIIYYITAYIISNMLLTIFGYLSYIFLFLSLFINLIWLYLAFDNFHRQDKKRYSMRLFLFSIAVVIWFNFLISIDYIF